MSADQRRSHLRIVYRTMSGEGGRSRPGWYSRERCAESLRIAVERCRLPVTVHAVNDGPTRSSALDVLHAAGVRTLDGIGNGPSYRAAVQYALEVSDPGDLVYFVEDDYLHLPESLNQLVAAAAQLPDRIRYYTLYEHPNAYLGGMAGPTSTQLVDGVVWRTIASTCMTFATSRETLARDRPVHELFFSSSVAEDFHLFLALHGGPTACRLLYAELTRLRGRARDIAFVALRDQIMRWSTPILAVSCPGLACHAELNAGLSPGRDWAAYAETLRR